MENSHFDYRKEKKTVTLRRNLRNEEMWFGAAGSIRSIERNPMISSRIEPATFQLVV
jgi:hypothetical protein